MTRSYAEDKIHIAIVENLRNIQQYFPLKFSHPANEGRSAAEGAKYKRMGVLAGMPDLICWWPGLIRYGHGMIEIKAPGGKLSVPQKTVKQWCHDMKINWGVAYSVEDAMALLKCWGVPIKENHYIQPAATPEQKKAFVHEMFKP